MATELTSCGYIIVHTTISGRTVQITAIHVHLGMGVHFFGSVWFSVFDTNLVL
jgi:hypothetical protein